MPSTCPVHLILDFITLIFAEEHRLLLYPPSYCPILLFPWPRILLASSSHIICSYVLYLKLQTRFYGHERPFVISNSQEAGDNYIMRSSSNINRITSKRLRWVVHVALFPSRILESLLFFQREEILKISRIESFLR